MTQRRLGAWLPSALVGGIGLVEGTVFLVQGRWMPAVVVLGGLGLVAWVLSPAAFPRAPSAHTLSRRAVDAQASTPEAIVIYWRPGCAYCLRLRWSLGRLARQASWVDIWADDDAAAFVRTVNDGDETVPTVVVGETTRTNPDVSWVRQELLKR